MDQAVDHGRDHLVVGKHRAAPGELEIGRDDHAPPLVVLGRDLERQLYWSIVNRHLGIYYQRMHLLSYP